MESSRVGSMIEILSKLRNAFSRRFEDIKKISVLVQFISSPFSKLVNLNELSVCIHQHFPMEDVSKVQLEIIDIQSDLNLKAFASPLQSIWPLVSQNKYPSLVSIAQRVQALFCSTYLCEISFSNMKIIKSRLRNRLTNNHLDDCMRMSQLNMYPILEKL